jgi:oligopeptide/dipeptide ABC transporter ATP-binding protein
MSIVDVKNLSIEFQVDGRWVPAVNNVSFDVKKGEILALVGESGCGKSVTCMSLARLLPEPPARYVSGEILLQGKSVLNLKKRELREVRRHNIGYIFQEPSVSLNPVFRVGDQIAEAVMLRKDASTSDVKSEVIELLNQVGISDPEERIRSYPHQLSGGMQQRIMIAMALAGKPDVLVADEPTTALDVTIQAQILDLLCEIRKTRDMSIILVTHNLGIVSDMADRVVVMYAGHTVESAPTEELMNNPLHPYTKALLSAVPKLGHSDEVLTTIPGTVPSPANYPEGCRFFGRCSLADDKKVTENELLCKSTVPDWREIDSVDGTKKGHFCRCHYSQ